MPESIDPESGMLQVRITGGVKAGDWVEPGTQIARIEGIPTSDDTAPFIIQDGRVIVNPIWKNPIRDLYRQLFGDDYTR
jgi:hypothetical protein